MEEFVTACPRNCYSTCSFRVQVENNRITRILPYSAKKIITKCNLCYSGLMDGRQPACSSACPTGALRFGQLSGQKSDIVYSWFPNKNLNPAIEFTANKNSDPLRIIPENIYKPEVTKPVKKGKNISGELSLIVFSFLTTLSEQV